MAMPPDGSSSWVKHDDVWLLESRGVRFASVSVAVDGSAASIAMPVIDSAYDSFYAVRFVRAEGGLEVFCGGAGEGVAWRPGAEVVPAEARVIYPRASYGAIDGGAPIAALQVAASGAIELVDPAGRVRVSAARERGVGPAAATRVVGCGGALVIDLFDYPDTAIRRVASSPP